MILRYVALAALWQRSLFALASHCQFPHSLITELNTFNCSSDNLELCARVYRRLVQNRLPGAWGVIVVENVEEVTAGRVKWHIERVGPKPNHCRLLTEKKWLVEIFRTGYRPQEIALHQRQWIKKQARSLGVAKDDLDQCPHSALRAIISKAQLLDERQPELLGHHFLHHSVARLAEVLAKETRRNWNVFATRKEGEWAPRIGYNVPHYVGDGRAGFCMGETADGFTVNAMLIGFGSEALEILAKG